MSVTAGIGLIAGLAGMGYRAWKQPTAEERYEMIAKILNQYAGPDAIAGGAKTIYNTAVSSPEATAARGQIGNTAAGVEANLARELGRNRGATSDYGAISKAISQGMGNMNMLNYLAQIWQSAIGASSTNVNSQAQAFSYGTQRIDPMHDPMMNLSAGLVAGASNALGYGGNA